MLNEQTILQAATSEKNAGDFPKVVQSFKELGVTKYQFLVQKGVYVFWDETDTRVESKLNGVSMPVAEEISSEKMKDAIKQAQAGKIDFEMFIKLAGLAGVGLWEADLTAMKVTYIDNAGNDLVVEPIPSV
ncbi:DUF1398 family protein [Listeria monocytogenes]|uniref:DUF1398 domain-containing protein n=1 Tax=Listeria monocytogenes TaxID=1639 RepID=UPI0005F0E516|nr:DUF1398 family protein [Listeria monocytogenes]EAG6361219.1 DUF1398 domain-containing protein [Listeria monocytogenes CFSAN002351]AKG84767.1 phage envelope protein [Listeria monocytogenes]AQP55453.1 DUF1398 domain-containing protein [Listeria monocytogenes]ASH55001.1 hypothetical protein A413_0628 [Listeria monocytogenes serotype 1/2a str. 10-4754]ASH57852.1 hypothetical protein A414_0628 [Listeria monocytogenes serotype 1/2a str. 10-4758]